jgi:hypothetical protein
MFEIGGRSTRSLLEVVEPSARRPRVHVLSGSLHDVHVYHSILVTRIQDEVGTRRREGREVLYASTGASRGRVEAPQKALG